MIVTDCRVDTGNRNQMMKIWKECGKNTKKTTKTMRMMNLYHFIKRFGRSKDRSFFIAVSSSFVKLDKTADGRAEKIDFQKLSVIAWRGSLPVAKQQKN